MSRMEGHVELVLDGKAVSAPEGELLVHAAARHGVFIPTLCHDDKLEPYGGCRMCVVSVEGAPRPVPACATRVRAGMVVSTNGPAEGFRKTLTEMLLTEHLNPSPGGRPNELADMAEEYGATAPFILPDAKREPYEDRNQLMGYDPDACILCNRCVRYTQEVMQCSALSLEGRGGHARIVPTWGKSWLDTECELCGGCLSVCPTGALYEKFLEGTEVEERKLEQVRSTCTFCGVGCQVDLNVDPATQADRQGHLEGRVPAERGQPLRQGPLRLQLRPPPRPPHRAARARRGRGAAPRHVGARAPGRGRRPQGGDDPPRPAGSGRTRERAADERGELPDPEVLPRRRRHELGPLLRSDLTRSHSLRPGQVVGQRSQHQLDPRDRERAFPLRDRLEHDGGAPGARAADEEGRAQRRHARRRRPAQDLADEAREAPPPAPPRVGRVAAERDDAHDPRGGATGRGLRPRLHGGLRGAARGRHALHPRGSRAGHGRPRRGDSGDRPRVRERAPRGDLLHARHHRARLRRGQHLVARRTSC